METTGYKHCYYDNFKKVLHLKEQDSNTWQKIKYEPYCYIESRDKSDIIDIHNHFMKRMNYKDKEVIAQLKNSNMVIAESDLAPEVKVMHDLYDKLELKPDVNKWNICMFDIEVASGSEFYDEFVIKYKPRDDGNDEYVESIDLFTFDTQFNHDAYLVYDIKLNKWINYSDSCFVNNDFPAADKAKWPINLISCYSTKTKEMHTFSILEYTGKKIRQGEYHYYKDELVLMREFLKWFHKQEYDIITGWNSVNYDVPYIVNRCQKLREIWHITTELERALSPLGKMPEEHKNFDRKMKDVDLGSTWTVPGLYSIDYMEMYKTFAKHPPLASFTLNYIGNLELGRGKLEYEGKISETYKKDKNTFAEYNREDVQLIVDMEEKLKLFPIIISYAFDCLVTLDKIYMKVPTTEGYILKFLHNKGKVLNDKVKNQKDWWRAERCYEVKQKDGSIYYQNTEWEPDCGGRKDFEKFLLKKRYLDGERSQELKSEIQKIYSKKGDKNELDVFMDDFNQFKLDPHPFAEWAVKAGYCYDFPGRYDHCMSFDITSSYPHHIMQFNISPETVCIHPTKMQIESGEVILSDVNELGFYRTDDAIIPSIVKQVFAERKHFKDLMKQAHKDGNYELEALYDNMQGNKKIIINSMYGVCLSPAFHLYSIDCARAICRCARVTLRDWLSKSVNDYYPTKFFLSDLEKRFNSITLTVDDKKYVYLEEEEITIQRNGEELKIQAKDFNIETDLLGVE